MISIILAQKSFPSAQLGNSLFSLKQLKGTHYSNYTVWNLIIDSMLVTKQNNQQKSMTTSIKTLRLKAYTNKLTKKEETDKKIKR